MGSEFGFAFFKTTILRGFLDAWFVYFSADLFTTNIAHLKAISGIESPTFTFAHLWPPHPPFLFDREGNVRNRVNYFSGFDDEEAFIDQLVWVNKSVSSTVDRILEVNKENSVIVIQGDHGTDFGDVQQALASGGELVDVVIQERTSILNAILLPETCESKGLYDSITPVNTFRLIMDNCWGTDFGLLQDQTYWSSYSSPFRLTAVDEPKIPAQSSSHE